MTELVEPKKKIITVLFPHDTQELRKDVKSGKAPSERLYGLKELEESDDFIINYTDYRFRGGLAGLQRRLRSY